MSSSSFVVFKSALTKLKNNFTPADSALNRATSLYSDDRDEVKKCLHLTNTEILLLTVLASQGLPVFSEDWITLIRGRTGEGQDFQIFYFAMTQVMLAASEVWLGITRKKLAQAILIQNDTYCILEKDQKHIALLKKDVDAKEATLLEAKTYCDDPLLFAKKCIFLLEAIRKSMGPVDLQYIGKKRIIYLNKSENWLGTKVVNWFKKDIQKWAVSLVGCFDKAGNVDLTTSISATKDHPQSHDAALMTQRDCRTIFIQIAQQTRLRSIFLKYKMIKLSTEFVPKVLKHSSFNAMNWEHKPLWWNDKTKDNSRSCCQDDIDLLAGILDYGYGGFGSLLNHDYSFCKQLSANRNGCSSMFTRSTVQVRINNLTRELHALDEREE